MEETGAKQMTLDQIRYFIELSKTLNFTRAAQNLYVSQPAFSKQIRNLEEELGVTLCARDHRNVSLTEAGIAFRQEFGPILSEIDAAVLRVTQAGKEIVRIGLFQPLSGNPACFSYLEEFSDQMSSAEIQIHLMRPDEILSAYRDGKADIFIAPDSFLSVCPGADHYEIAPLNTVLACAFPLDNEDIPARLLSEKTWVLLKDQAAAETRDRLQHWLSEKGIHPKESLITDDIAACTMALKRCRGFAILETHAAEQNPDLSLIPIRNEELPQNIVLLWNKNKK